MRVTDSFRSVALAMSVCFSGAGSICAGNFRLGAASVDITPNLGTPLAGYYSERGAEGIHDPLLAKAIVLQNGETKAALVSMDLISTLRSTVEEARSLIEKETGIPGRNVMISATHSHTGPILSGSPRADALGGAHQLAREYTRKLPRLIADAVQEANRNTVRAKAGFGSSLEPNLAFNRRFHMRDGSIGWNPGRLNPKIIRPTAPTDDEVQVVYFESLEGSALATYVNFPMHLDTVGGKQFSADYPHTLSELLARVKGPEMLTLFTIGCAGDINHINVHWATQPRGHGEAARIGTILAANVLRTYERLNTNVAAAKIAASSEKIQLPLPDISAADLEQAKKVADQVRAKSEPAPKFMDQVHAFKVLDVEAREGKPHEVEVQVITLGKEIAWVSLPGEIFVELGLSIKAGSPFQLTLIAELANGSIGYIPTQRAYAEGNYEVVSARCAEGSGELLVESAVRQLRRLFTEAHAEKSN